MSVGAGELVITNSIEFQNPRSRSGCCDVPRNMPRNMFSHMLCCTNNCYRTPTR